MSKETFFDAYVECALWTTNDESDESGGRPLDENYDPEDIDPKTLAEMRRECDEFYDANQEMFDHDAQAGHDFWLTRNGHGAGFWDGDYPEHEGKALTDASKAYGSSDLFLGNDGVIYGN